MKARAERAFVLGTLAAIMLPSFGSAKLYPFNPPSFFVTRASHYCQYAVTDPDGRALPLHEVGLGDFYLGQSGNTALSPAQETGAVQLPATVNTYGRVHAQGEVVEAVRSALRSRPGLAYVTVTQRVVGPVDASSVAVIQTHRWRIATDSVVSERPEQAP